MLILPFVIIIDSTHVNLGYKNHSKLHVTKLERSQIGVVEASTVEVEVLKTIDPEYSKCCIL
jgi:hypothetical protein